MQQVMGPDFYAEKLLRGMPGTQGTLKEQSRNARNERSKQILWWEYRAIARLLCVNNTHIGYLEINLAE